MGVKKSAAHRAAISAALKAKWEDPNYIKKQRKTARSRKSSKSSAHSTRNKSAREQQQMTPQARKRTKLVQEMKDIYIKATAAVEALEQRKLEGQEVDESMLSKALLTVEETRKVLQTVGVDVNSLKDGEEEEEEVYEEEEEEEVSAGATVVHVRGGKTVGVSDVDVDGISAG